MARQELVVPRVVGLGCLRPREGGEAQRLGSEGALDERSKHLNCSVVPGGLKLQGLGKGRPGVLT